MESLREFILNNWANTIREVKTDSGTLIALPKPFTIPSINDYFQEMFYWDTYFTNVGLVRDGLRVQAENNCENFRYLVERFGFIPNGTRTYYLSRSQPPYFAFAVNDLYGNSDELLNYYGSLKKEYEWWMKNRCTEIGLNRYGDNGVLDSEYLEGAQYAMKRMLLNDYKGDKKELGKDHFAVCESGWDCSPRFDGVECRNACPIDLNCNLWFYENLLGKIKERFCIEDDNDWKGKADARKAAIIKYMRDDATGLYYDYNFKTGKKFKCLSAATFHPYFVMMEDVKRTDGLKNAYLALVKEYGLCCTEKDYGFYQWSYPNGWAPLHYIAYVALKNYGFNAKARELAEKWTSLLEKVYDKTGTTYEKYNVIAGNDDTFDEGNIHHTMMGWTSGVYSFFKDELANE